MIIHPTDGRSSSRLVIVLVVFLGIACQTNAQDAPTDIGGERALVEWRDEAVAYARIMSRVKWTPVADSMPMRGGQFQAGVEYTGVPYSSVKLVGRYIGFDIFLKTFLAAVENPESVLYTENLRGEVSNAECYYGKVCSSYTSYALKCGIWYISRACIPPHRDGVHRVTEQVAQSAKVGDFIFTPPRPGSHIELVTAVTRNESGIVTHVRVEESRPTTTKNTNRSAAEFNAHLSEKKRALYRISDLDAWRGENRAGKFLFPNYSEDAVSPQINRVLLLDRGDWVVYRKDQAVKFNLMDRDDQGVGKLVIQRGETVVEEIDAPGKGVIERSYANCGDYTAHCVMQDGTHSQACEFSVCGLDFVLPSEPVPKNGALSESQSKAFEVRFTSDNMNVIIVYLRSRSLGEAPQMVFPNETDRANGSVTIPVGMIPEQRKAEIWLIGENKYGRLKVRKEFTFEK